MSTLRGNEHAQSSTKDAEDAQTAHPANAAALQRAGAAATQRIAAPASTAPAGTAQIEAKIDVHAMRGATAVQTKANVEAFAKSALKLPISFYQDLDAATGVMLSFAPGTDETGMVSEALQMVGLEKSMEARLRAIPGVRFAETTKPSTYMVTFLDPLYATEIQHALASITEPHTMSLVNAPKTPSYLVFVTLDTPPGMDPVKTAAQLSAQHPEIKSTSGGVFHEEIEMAVST